MEEEDLGGDKWQCQCALRNTPNGCKEAVQRDVDEADSLHGVLGPGDRFGQSQEESDRARAPRGDQLELVTEARSGICNTVALVATRDTPAEVLKGSASGGESEE